jgi:hypothetical protein
LRSRIIFIQLGAKIFMQLRLRLLPHYKCSKPKFSTGIKVTRSRRSQSRIALRLRLHQNNKAPCCSGSTTLFGAPFSSDFCMIEMVKNLNGKSRKLFHFLTFLKFNPLVNIKFEARAVGAGAGAASRCGCGITETMWLQFRNNGLHVPFQKLCIGH